MQGQSHTTTFPEEVPPNTQLHQALEFKISSPLPAAWKWSGHCWGEEEREVEDRWLV